jgi:hypothetical protein
MHMRNLHFYFYALSHSRQNCLLPSWRTYVCLSFHGHSSARLPPEEIPWRLISETFVKMCREIRNLITIWKNVGHFNVNICTLCWCWKHWMAKALSSSNTIPDFWDGRGGTIILWTRRHGSSYTHCLPSCFSILHRQKLRITFWSDISIYWINVLRWTNKGKAVPLHGMKV